MPLELHKAIKDGNKERFAELPAGALGNGCLDEVDEEGNTPLHIAAQNGHTTAITAMLGAAGVDAQELLFATTRSGFTPIHLAAEDGHTAAITAMLCDLSEEKVVHLINGAMNQNGLNVVDVSVNCENPQKRVPTQLLLMSKGGIKREDSQGFL